jgi:hypothetical protein
LNDPHSQISAKAGRVGGDCQQALVGCSHRCAASCNRLEMVTLKLCKAGTKTEVGKVPRCNEDKDSTVHAERCEACAFDCKACACHCKACTYVQDVYRLAVSVLARL